MNIGSAVRMTACKTRHAAGDVIVEASFKAEPGQQFVFLLLGAEPEDGSAPLLATALLEEWGWTRASDLVGEEPDRQAVAALAEVLRSRGRRNTLFDINRAADALDDLIAYPARSAGNQP